MVTREENERMTLVGKGTPGGELLRRYWYPVAVAKELTEENPTKSVRMLGEDLVLFKDKGGRVGLIADRCAHRGASLAYGRVEERGIACAYHGWLYDVEGNCLECPAEPVESKFHLTVKHTAYPVQKFVGLYWTYMGPRPEPLIPKYDVWARPDGTRRISVKPQLDCNWFQAMENSVDPAHLQILHQDAAARRREVTDTTRGLTNDVEKFEFIEVPYGIMKKRTYRVGFVDEHPLIFPNILRLANYTHVRVPVDDTHTRIFYIIFEPAEDGKPVEDDDDPPVEYVEPFKSPVDQRHPVAKFTRMDRVDGQDYMAWETQGPIADRTTERLATSDRGIVILRDLLKREIEKVQKGQDPLGVIRDPAQHVLIETGLTAFLQKMRDRRQQEWHPGASRNWSSGTHP